jgi:hypothetical protein
VIEIGTGTGILAVLAARAGARVTAIERFSVVRIAQAVARQSGVADRITFVRGRSDLIHLDERGDVLLSELVGNRILNEGLLEATLDARHRLLKPEARLIPRRLEILGEVGYTARFSRMEDEVTGIGERYGVNLKPLRDWFAARLATGQIVWELNGREDAFIPLTEEASLITLDLEELQSASFTRSVTLPPLRGGTANAALLAFRLDLQPGIELTTTGRTHEMHWSKPVYMLREPLSLRPGQPVTLEIAYEPHGEIAVSATLA